jgi:hypothetical protein
VALAVVGSIVGVVLLTVVLSVFINPVALNLDDKVVVITGGSSGIGLACAKVRGVNALIRLASAVALLHGNCPVPDELPRLLAPVLSRSCSPVAGGRIQGR